MKSVINRMGRINPILQNIKVDSGEIENTTYTMKQLLYEEVFIDFGRIHKGNDVLKTAPHGYGGNNRCRMIAKGGA